KQDCRLADLPVEEFQAAHESLDNSVYDVLGTEKAVIAFKSMGSTNPRLVDEQVTQWRERLEM
ncbi:MAG: argininosuccinate lyase, partial [Aeoliella sp.]